MSYTNEQIKALAEQFICHSASRSIDEVEMAGGMLFELLESENNLRQQIAHLKDDITGLKSNVDFVSKQRDELQEKRTARTRDLSEQLANAIDQRDALLKICEELQESAEYWSEYDIPIGIVERLDNAINSIRGNHPAQALDMVETTAPALIFYPAGSLGEEV